jgi:predicted XRE-type DNA-binding protein
MPHTRRGGACQRLTAAMAARIKRLWNETEMAQHEIAATLGVNQGRVSEVVNGARFADVAPEESTERH